MNRHDITAELKKRGSSAAHIGREFGTSKMAASKVISGHSRSRRIEARVSEITGLPLTQLWPQWYVSDGSVEQSPDPMDAIPARLCAEKARLQLETSTMAALGCVDAKTQKAFERGAQPPDALYLAKLARIVHLDALYVITGRRECDRMVG